MEPKMEPATPNSQDHESAVQDQFFENVDMAPSGASDAIPEGKSAVQDQFFENVAIPSGASDVIPEGEAIILDNDALNDIRRQGKAKSRRRSSGFSKGMEDVGSKIHQRFSLYEDSNSSDMETPKTIWSRMAKKKDGWDDDDKEEEEVTFSDAVAGHWAYVTTSFKIFFAVSFENPTIIVGTLLTFALLTAVGVAVTLKFAANYELQKRDAANDIAIETGAWFSSQLDQALVPLFTMAEFVHRTDIFLDLPHQIGIAGELGAAPLIAKPDGSTPSHRNVTGICDNPSKVEEFNQIASGIKEHSGMAGVLVSLQIAPYASVCNIYPLVNTEDFPEGVVMNNTGAIGHDLLNDPNRVAIARATVPADGVVIAGPLTLVQGGVPVVSTALIARLAINMPGYLMTIDGVDYECWGFAVTLLNWAELVDRSDIYTRFEKQQMQFRLTRTDTKWDDDGVEYQEEKLLAESAGAEALKGTEGVAVDLDTTNNVWQMMVWYDDGFESPSQTALIAAVTVASFLVSLLVMMILVKKQQHHSLLKEMLPLKVLRKIERGETVIEKYNIVTTFFSDIVGFTSMSGEMRPIEVMRMLNDLYLEFDRVAAKRNVFKVDVIGDAFMVMGGAPDRCSGPEGAEKVALFAIDCIKVVEKFRTSDGSQIFIRAGLHTGPVVAGVVGKSKPKYTVFGDSVNAASRMESTSEKMRIQCSDFTRTLLLDAPNVVFDLEDRGDIEMKGKGKMHTWWINGTKKSD